MVLVKAPKSILGVASFGPITAQEELALPARILKIMGQHVGKQAECQLAGLPIVVVVPPAKNHAATRECDGILVKDCVVPVVRSIITPRFLESRF